MVHAAQYYPTLISLISHGLRFLPAFSHMRRYISSGYIGSAYLCDIRVTCGSLIGSQFNWTCSHLMGGGVLTTIGSHIIDILSFVVGQRALRVSGWMKTFVKSTENINGIRWIDSDDFCTFQMMLENDICATVTVNSHVALPFNQEVTICGSEGNLIVRGSNLYGIKKTNGEEELLYEDNELSSSNMSNMKVDVEVESVLSNSYIQGLFRLITALRDAFSSGGAECGWLKEPVSFAATFEDGQYVQAVIDAIKLSSKSRQWEQVNITQEESELTSVSSRHNFPSELSALQALSRSSTSRTPLAKKAASVDSHTLWGFGSHKH